MQRSTPLKATRELTDTRVTAYYAHRAIHEKGTRRGRHKPAREPPGSNQRRLPSIVETTTTISLTSQRLPRRGEQVVAKRLLDEDGDEEHEQRHEDRVRRRAAACFDRVPCQLHTGEEYKGRERTPLRRARHFDDPDRVVGAPADEDRRRGVELERRDREVVRVEDGQDRLRLWGEVRQDWGESGTEEGEGGRRTRRVTASRMPTLRSDDPYASSVPSSLHTVSRMGQYRRSLSKQGARGKQKDGSRT